jgi:hypothetical protein
LKEDAMSKRRSDPDQELRDIKARDREEREAQEIRDSEKRRQEREQQRIPRAIDALRNSGPLDDRTADEVWLDLLAELLDALSAAGKAELLHRLPDRGNARRFTRRCAELLTAGQRREALSLLEDIGPGELDKELARERNTDFRTIFVNYSASRSHKRRSPYPNRTPLRRTKPQLDGATTHRQNAPRRA